MVQWLLVCSGCPQKRIDCTCSRPARGGRRGSTPPKIKSVPTLEKLPYSKKALSLGMTKIWTPWEDLGMIFSWDFDISSTNREGFNSVPLW
jgi:hypothetical protein